MNIKKINKILACALAVGVIVNVTDVRAFAFKESERRLVTEPYGATPTKDQVNFQKDELTAFIHFGINTFTDREWGDGTESPSLFNPTDLDAEQWVLTLAEAGFKKVILTAKHHDGFSLWDTADSTHDVASSPWKNGEGDVVKEVSEACAKYGLKMGIYLSPWDQNSKDYGEGNGGDYNEYYMKQIRELLTNYGEISEFWMDGAKGSNVQQDYRFQDWFDLIYELQPNCVIFSPEGPDVRWIGNENGYAGETCWSTISRDKMREREIPSYLNTGEENGPDWIVGESDVSIRPGWYYHESQDNSVKSIEKLMDIYYKSVGRNSILLLNTPPDKTGKLHANDVERIKEFGEAVRQTFDEDIAVNKNVITDSVADNDLTFGADKIVDNDYDTYWAPDNGATEGTIEIDLGGEKEFDVISIQEYIPLGQRIKSFDVEVMKGGEWKTVSQGTTVGYKKYVRIAPTIASKVRINIKGSLATPLINNVGVYKQPTNIELPAGPPEGLKFFNDGTTGTGIGEFNFSSEWVFESKDGALNGDGHYTTTTGATSKIKFNGTKLYLAGSKDPGHGIMEVSIDGGATVDVDLYSEARKDGVIVYETPDLENGEHEITIKHSGRKNAAAGGNAAYVDGAYVLDNDGKGMFEFEQLDYTVKENVGTATFKVVRKGGSNGKAEVNYDTIAGTAINGEDYVRWSGTLAFNPGENEKTFDITIIDDKLMEETENFYLALSDPIGGAIVGFDSQAKVNIEDDELVTINVDSKGTEINQFNFKGVWNDEPGEVWTRDKSATFDLKFQGKKISLVGAKDPNHGVYQVAIDGGEFKDVEAYSANRLTEQVIFESEELAYGEHTLNFRIKGENPNPGRGDTQINHAIVDASINENPEVPDETIVVSKINNLKSSEVKKEEVKLTWDDPNSVVGLSEYIVYKDGKEFAKVPVGTNEITIEGLKSNTIYGFKVTSKYSNGEESKPKSISIRTKK